MNDSQRIIVEAEVGELPFSGSRFGALPLTDYTPDFLPLSIGSGSKRVTGRAIFTVQTASGTFVDATTGYTWRAHVTLDRRG
jgi:hypothetical protein